MTTRPRGTVDKRNGLWSYRISYTDAAGNRHRPRRQGFATKREAEQALTAHLRELDAGPRRTTGPRYTGEYLTAWLATYVRSGSRKRSTTVATSVHVERYLVPRIGSIPLAKLGPDDVAQLYGDLLASGGSGRRKPSTDPDNPNPATPLAAKTVRNIAGTLHKALSDAVRRGYLLRNPAEGVDLPRWERPELTVWDDAQVARFFEHAYSVDDPYVTLWRLLLTTGLRRGELLGLRWADIDLVNGTITIVVTRVDVRGTVIVETPKTRAGRRTVAIDPDTVTELAHLKNAHEYAAQVLGAWPSPYVGTNLDGHPIKPQTLTKRFRATAKAAGLPIPRLHDGRHTSAVLQLQHGVPIHVVAGRLGHAKVSTTLDVYTAFIPSADRMAADIVGRVIAAGPDPKRVPKGSLSDEKGPKLAGPRRTETDAPSKFAQFRDTFPDGANRDDGGDDGNRTHDPLLAKQVLCQLSYVPWITREPSG